MPNRKIIIVGGGAAGLMAAGQAAQLGAETLVLEKMDRPGRKLAITGKGRCNLTNTAPMHEFINRFKPDGRFLYQAFSMFFSSELTTFFKELDVNTVEERGGRVFPESGRARDIVDALSKWARKCGAAFLTGSPADRLIVENGRVSGVGVSLSGSHMINSRSPQISNSILHTADAVILATGGASYPSTGSTGDGYRLAQSSGHTIRPIRPALVPVETAGDIAAGMQNLILRNVMVRLRLDGKKAADAFGEIQFTPFGLSGPVILSLSGQIVDALCRKKETSVSIDLKPALSKEKLDTRLLRDLNGHGRRQFKTLLKELLPKKLIPVCIELTGIASDKPGHQITAVERRRLSAWLKDFRLEITGHRPFSEAIITAGGVDTREVDPRTMASRIVEGLYFAGEVLDINGDTGGYNLQSAFSTGFVAGRAAAVQTGRT